MSTERVRLAAKALTAALDVARGSLVEVQHARVTPTAVVLIVETPEQAKDLAWHFGATCTVTAHRYAYTATARVHAATKVPVLIEAQGRPRLPALAGVL